MPQVVQDLTAGEAHDHRLGPAGDLLRVLPSLQVVRGDGAYQVAGLNPFAVDRRAREARQVNLPGAAHHGRFQFAWQTGRLIKPSVAPAERDAQKNQQTGTSGGVG